MWPAVGAPVIFIQFYPGVVQTETVFTGRLHCVLFIRYNVYNHKILSFE